MLQPGKDAAKLNVARVSEYVLGDMGGGGFSSFLFFQKNSVFDQVFHVIVVRPNGPALGRKHIGVRISSSSPPHLSSAV